jgi:hypothetical protein
MFHVFTADEITLWRDWVLALGNLPPKPAGAGAAAGVAHPAALAAGAAPPTRLRSPVSDSRFASWQQMAQAQDAPPQPPAGLAAAAGPAAAAPAGSDRLDRWIAWSMLRAVTHLATHNPRALEDLRAFAHGPAPGHGATCAQWRDAIRRASNPAEPGHEILQELAQALSAVGGAKHAQLADPAVPLPAGLEVPVPGNDGSRVLDTLAAWIAHGCPVPPAVAGKMKPLRLDCTLDEEEQHPVGFSLGFGTVH